MKVVKDKNLKSGDTIYLGLTAMQESLLQELETRYDTVQGLSERQYDMMMELRKQDALHKQQLNS